MLAHLIALFYFMRHVCYRYITLNSSQRTCNELTLFHVSAQIWFIVFSFSFWFNRVTKNRFQNILSLLLLLQKCSVWNFSTIQFCCCWLFVLNWLLSCWIKNTISLSFFTCVNFTMHNSHTKRWSTSLFTNLPRH